MQLNEKVNQQDYVNSFRKATRVVLAFVPRSWMEQTFLINTPLWPVSGGAGDEDGGVWRVFKVERDNKVDYTENNTLSHLLR